MGPTQEEFERVQEGILSCSMCVLYKSGWCVVYIELRVAQANLVAMKEQAESTNTEYDRLAEEHQKLQVCLMYVVYTCIYLMVVLR